MKSRGNRLLRSFAIVLPLIGSLNLSISAGAETVADRKRAVLQDRSTLLDDLRWIYDDYERGFAEGRATGKPVLVVLRCIPCLACIGIDSAVLLENSSLSPLLDRFVCVRVVNANALDLARFQFDYDLSFSALIFNGDGTLYARYGSWTHQKNPTDNATEGLRATLEGALALHAGYPDIKPLLSGKQGRPSPYKTPLDMPSLRGKYQPQLDWEGQVVQSCVHCHQIGDALRTAVRERKEPLPEHLIFPHPAPETLGMRLAADTATTLREVVPGSAADKAGLKPGDRLILMNRQSVVSAADVAWVLHHAPETGSLSVSVQRPGEEKPAARTLVLAEGWRRQADIARRVGTWAMRAMALGGMLLEDLSDEARKARGLDESGLALLVKHVGEYGEHAAAKKAGFRKDDVIVVAAESSRRESESALIGRLLTVLKPGDSVAATVVRGSERLDLRWPIQ